MTWMNTARAFEACANLSFAEQAEA